VTPVRRYCLEFARVLAVAGATAAGTLGAIFLLVFPTAATWGSRSSAWARILNTVWEVLLFPGLLLERWTDGSGWAGRNVYLASAVGWGAIAGLVYAVFRKIQASSRESKDSDS
jgi:hypothetical protein